MWVGVGVCVCVRGENATERLGEYWIVYCAEVSDGTKQRKDLQKWDLALLLFTVSPRIVHDDVEKEEEELVMVCRRNRPVFSDSRRLPLPLETILFCVELNAM